MVKEQNMDKKNTKRLDMILWVAQALIATSFIWAAFMKLFSAPEDLSAMWPWTEGTRTLVVVSAFIDILGGVGIILPSIVNANNKWAIYAGYGVIALMIAATVFHVSRGEAGVIGVNIFFIALAVFVIWGRKKVKPRAKIY